MFLYSLICFAIDIIVQVASFRYIPRLGLLKSEYLGFASGFITLLILKFFLFFAISTLTSDFVSVFIADLVIYSSLGYCYFHFINLGETARRIRILRELYESKGGLSMEGILEKYNASEILTKRIDRLINNGQIVYKDGRYYIGNSLMLNIAKIITGMKIMLLDKKSEFD